MDSFEDEIYNALTDDSDTDDTFQVVKTSAIEISPKPFTYEPICFPKPKPVAFKPKKKLKQKPSKKLKQKPKFRKNNELDLDYKLDTPIGKYLKSINIELVKIFGSYIEEPFTCYSYRHETPYVTASNEADIIKVFYSNTMSVYKKVYESYFKSNNHLRKKKNTVSFENTKININMQNGFPRFSIRHISIFETNNIIINAMTLTIDQITNQLRDYFANKIGGMLYTLSITGVDERVKNSVIRYLFAKRIESLKREIRCERDLPFNIIKKSITAKNVGDNIVLTFKF